MLDLLKAGRSVADLVRDLQISDQTIYTWRLRRPRTAAGAVVGYAVALQRVADDLDILDPRLVVSIVGGIQPALHRLLGGDEDGMQPVAAPTWRR